MKNIIVGTAGHIDHGKTSLVKALTGIDADRLAEEKRRGITIDLGFAHLQLTEQVRVGFVDVPGHERFVRNMLAGVGGIDVVLFVIAADESIKPQTREHFDICALLGIRHGVIALTKSDVAGQEMVDLVRLEVEEFVEGSFLEGAEIVAVSAVTGAGLAELRGALERAAAQVPVRDPAGPMRLPIDRSFTVQGFGTVVTGTLTGGSIGVEDEVELLPGERLLRVRGLEAYGEATTRAKAGTRTAVNLAGIEHAQVHRGMVLAEPGMFRAVRQVDARLKLLKGAKALKNGAPAHFHSGTAETPAVVRLIGGDVLQPGDTTWVRIRFARPMVVAPGDRFILRNFSPVVTIGGGTVVDTAPSRMSHVERAQLRLEVLAGPDAARKVALLTEEADGPLAARELSARLGWREPEAKDAALRAGALVIDPGGWIVSVEWARAKQTALTQAVRAYHAAAPLEFGLAKADLKARVLARFPTAVFDHLVRECDELVIERELIRYRSHQVALNTKQDSARMAILGAFESAGLTAPSLQEVLQHSGVDQASARTILQMLLKERLLIRINEGLILHSSAVAKMRELLSVRRHIPFSIADFKGWTGVSRKYAVPLLEYCDRERLTVRRGDLRSVL